MTTKFTPGPWPVEEYDSTGGYDCMYGAICIGHIRLDGYDYGHDSCKDIDPEQLERMQADAHLISAAPDLLEALQGMVRAYEAMNGIIDNGSWHSHALVAIAKALGEQ